MDPKRIVALVVGASVMVLIFSALLVPIINDATTTERTLTNTGYFNMNKITDTDETTHTIAWDATNSQVLTVDGVDMPVSNWGIGSYQQVTVFATETDLIRVNPISGGQSISWVQIRGNQVNYAQANSTFSATMSEGSATISVDSSPWSLTYSEAYIITNGEGQYTMKKADETAYMLSDSLIYSLGYTQLPYSGGNDNVVFGVNGNINAVNVSVVRHSAATTISISDVEIHKTEVASYVGVSAFDKITFVATDDGTPTDVTYSYVIVPAEITAELAVHPDDGTRALLSAIPIIAMIGIVLAVVGVAIVGRSDY